MWSEFQLPHKSRLRTSQQGVLRLCGADSCRQSAFPVWGIIKGKVTPPPEGVSNCFSWRLLPIGNLFYRHCLGCRWAELLHTGAFLMYIIRMNRPFAANRMLTSCHDKRGFTWCKADIDVLFGFIGASPVYRSLSLNLWRLHSKDNCLNWPEATHQLM